MSVSDPNRAAAAGPLVPCPTCRRLTPYRSDNAWRPFCSERCKMSDLGAWATEQFRVEGTATEEDDDDAAARGAGARPRDPH
jgi:endogenous inhibitor of DNA gyrase (YacG/DUF329 family)